MIRSVDITPPESEAEWDGFVRAHPDWTPYHLYGWRRVIERVHGHECQYLAARGDDGAIQGILPLVNVRSRLFGRFTVSMPFLNYGGPLGTAEAMNSLASAARQHADERGVDLLELRCSRDVGLSLRASHRKITVLLDLPAGDPESLWKNLPAKLRSQVRRPMKEGIETRFGADQLDGFYHVFSRHMRDLGTPVQPKAFFAEASAALGETMWFGCAYAGGQPIAGGCGFRWADRFELVWASSLREFSRSAPNMLLYWRFIERCAGDGVTVFDFGRCTPGGGTHRFKSQWGGRDQPLWWYQHGADEGTPSPDSGPYSLGPKLWTRLPLAVANAVGPRIVKFIP